MAGHGWRKREVMTSSREEGTGTMGSVMTPASTRFLLAVPKALSISSSTGKNALLGGAAILPKEKCFYCGPMFSLLLLFISLFIII